MAKRALVLGGGGAKGSYQMGVWQALREAGCGFDMIVGTSIGALNGAMMAQNDFEAADELWSTIEYKNLFGEEQNGGIRTINSTLDMVRFAINDAALVGRVDSAPLEALVRSAVDEGRVRASKTAFGLVAVELPMLRPVTPMIDEIPEGRLYQYLMASSACFPVFSPYDIDGVKYIDGGYYDNVPIGFAVGRGAGEIVAVDLDGVGFVKAPKNAGELPVTRISSHWELGAVFDFDQSLFARNRKLGYYETLKAFGQKEGGYYTFAMGESRLNLRRLADGSEKLFDNIAALLKRPVARTITAVEKDEVIGMLAGFDRQDDAAGLLCRIAEAAGVVYGLPPDREYAFERFNGELLRRFGARRELLSMKEGLFAAEDIRRVIAAVLEFREPRTMSAALARLMRAQKYDEALYLLAGLLPREYIAAEYIDLLLRNCG